jgi:hypothetical protein
MNTGDNGEVSRRDSGTHDEQHRDGILAAYGDQIGRVCIVTGTNDVNECAVVVSEVHNFSIEQGQCHGFW